MIKGCYPPLEEFRGGGFLAGDPDTPHTSRHWLVMPVQNITIGAP